MVNLIARTAYPVANAPGTHHFLVCAPAPSTHTHAGVLAERQPIDLQKKKTVSKSNSLVVLLPLFHSIWLYWYACFSEYP